MKPLIIGKGQIGTTLGHMFGDVDYYDIKESTEEQVDKWYDDIHICFPYSPQFAQHVFDYIKRYSPQTCTIHATVMPGTTSEILKLLNEYDNENSCCVAYSPCRGRHGEDGQMETDFYYFLKFVGAPIKEHAEMCALNLISAGFKVRVVDTAEELELGKILQTTQSGVLIAMAQAFERYCKVVGVNYFDAMQLCDMPHGPSAMPVPGHIGGHCIEANFEFLLELVPSELLPTWIKMSNELKKSEKLPSGKRLYPIPYRQNV